MIKVKSFLGCAKLEKGGLLRILIDAGEYFKIYIAFLTGIIIGWISLVEDVFTLIVSIVAFAMLCVYGCDNVDERVKKVLQFGAEFEGMCVLGHKGERILILILLMLNTKYIFNSRIGSVCDHHSYQPTFHVFCTHVH